MKRQPLFLGANWKMHPAPSGALAEGTPYFSTGDPQIVVFPSFIDLQNCIRSGELIVGAQCGRGQDEGAYTGDISMKMLKEFGCSYVLCGHSERRQHHHETDEQIAAQVRSAIEHGLTAILCIGETADERELGKTREVLQRQLQPFLDILGAQKVREGKTEDLPFVLIAYEPVWAIGTGKTPTPEEAEEIHRFIRSLLPKKDIRIIYGGSMNGSNAGSFLSKPNIDGGLIGGASLVPKDFSKIVEAAQSVH
jgi:triosephosphate isomerase (TIM)